MLAHFHSNHQPRHNTVSHTKYIDIIFLMVQVQPYNPRLADITLFVSTISHINEFHMQRHVPHNIYYISDQVHFVCIQRYHLGQNMCGMFVALYAFICVLCLFAMLFLPENQLVALVFPRNIV